MTNHQKKSTKKSVFLWIIIFSHILPIIVSAFYDQVNHSNYSIELTNPKYWFWAFTWWSAWTSLLTVPWAFYKLFNLKKKSGFKEQIWDALVAEANFISGVIFCCGGFYLTINSALKNPQAVYLLIGKTKAIYVWLFYNFFWHVLAPGLTFYYFWNYCKTDKLIKKKTFGLVINLINPTIYFLYVMIRPLVGNFLKPPSSYPHYYPCNYPYPPFFWIAGQFANKEELKAERNKFFFSWKPSLVSGLIWLIIIIVFWYSIFSLLFQIFIKINRQKNKNLIN
ncbi:MAG: hypothetical protein mread185_000551 [Mycoplasmataceae bacterium]|nr:MAG: hypothetical protein mread185_000551 [Mycoplasmataceae bacterium]